MRRRATFRSIIVIILCCLFPHSHAIYSPLREYEGITFFDRWVYYANVDNTTWGNVTYVDKQAARAKRLTVTNSRGNAIIKVDNETTVPLSTLVHRDTIRITSLDTYTIGSLLIIDVIHLPYGCSVWPSFWTYGMQREWPNAGEIDIIEAINGMPQNQVALHTLPGCMKTEIPGQQTGLTLDSNCSSVRGCIVQETKNNSYGVGFARAGGGVFAVQIAESGVYAWFWSRPDIPDIIKNATSSSRMDTASWGTPTAAYPASACSISEYFPPQNLVLDTTLCGTWAGSPDIYSATCNGSCVADNVVGNGSNYATAYWEIRYLRTYYDEAIGPPNTTYTSSSTSPTASRAVASSMPNSTSMKNLPIYLAGFGSLLLIITAIYH